MLGVICKVIAAVAMAEHRETSAMQHQPFDGIADSRCGNGHLAGPARVGAYRPAMHPPHRHMESILHRRTQRPGFLSLVSVEIDVCMIVRERLHFLLLRQALANRNIVLPRTR